jgi:hypothetical protein
MLSRTGTGIGYDGLTDEGAIGRMKRHSSDSMHINDNCGASPAAFRLAGQLKQLFVRYKEMSDKLLINGKDIKKHKNTLRIQQA